MSLLFHFLHCYWIESEVRHNNTSYCSCSENTIGLLPITFRLALLVKFEIFLL